MEHMYLIASREVTKLQLAWTALREHFECPSLSDKMTLKAQLFRFQMKPGNSIQVHLKELNELVEKLAALDAPVSEQDQVTLLPNSLPSSFEGLVTAYIAKGEVCMAELLEALINHESRHENPSPNGASGSSAGYSGASSAKGKKRNRGK